MSRKSVRPLRISRVSLKTDSVLELPPHTIYRTGTKVGDALEISSAHTPRNDKDKQQASESVTSANPSANSRPRARRLLSRFRP